MSEERTKRNLIIDGKISLLLGRDRNDDQPLK